MVAPPASDEPIDLRGGGLVHRDVRFVVTLDRRGVITGTSLGAIGGALSRAFHPGGSVFLLPADLQWLSALIARALTRRGAPPGQSLGSTSCSAVGDLAGATCRATAEPLFDAYGVVSGVVLTADRSPPPPACDESDELVRTRQRAQVAEARSAAQTKRVRFLADASLAFAEAGVDYEVIVETIAKRLTESIGDGCIIRLLSEDNLSLELLTFYHHDAGRLAEGRRILAASPRRVDEGLFGDVIRTGQSRLIVDPRPEVIAPETSAEYQAFLRGFRSMILVPLRRAGHVSGTIALVRDRSSAPLGEDDLALLEDLAERAALALEIGRLFREAQEAIRVRDEFLFLAGHELKTPLTSAKLRIQQLRRLAGAEGDGAEGDARSKSIGRGLELLERLHARLDRLMDELLDVAQLRDGPLSIQSEEVDLGQVVHEVVARHHDAARRAGSTITVASEPGVVGVWDRPRVAQLLANLLINAIKFGEGRPIRIDVERVGGYARMAVRDQGVGITDDDQARIFERFERAVSAGHYGGFGLGLYIAAQIVHSHDGNIRVESALGQGSSFIVELPLRHERGHLHRERHLSRPQRTAPRRSR